MMTLLADSTRWYLAGPMSGVPQFNIPKFDAISAKLRGDGFTIISPAELDSPLMRARALQSQDGDLRTLEKETHETWGDVLARDVKLVADGIDGIVFMEDWQKSRGARLEAFVGLLTGKKFAIWQTYTGTAFEVSALYVRAIVGDNLP